MAAANHARLEVIYYFNELCWKINEIGCDDATFFFTFFHFLAIDYRPAARDSGNPEGVADGGGACDVANLKRLTSSTGFRRFSLPSSLRSLVHFLTFSFRFRKYSRFALFLPLNCRIEPNRRHVPSSKEILPVCWIEVDCEFPLDVCTVRFFYFITYYGLVLVELWFKFSN